MQPNSQTLYEVLGVPETATHDEIRAAYRKITKTIHPDVSKEDADRFNRAKHAHDVLTDAERRARYDETGDSRDQRRVPNKERAMVMVLLTQIVEGIVFADGPDDELEMTDVPVKVLENLQIIRGEYAVKRKQLLKKIKRANQLLARLRPPEETDTGPSPLLSVLSGGLVRLHEEQDALSLAERVHDEAVRIWSEHGYTVEDPFGFLRAGAGDGQRPYVRLGRMVGDFKRLPPGPQGSATDET